MSKSPRILLFEGNLRENCDRAVAHGALSASDRYAHSLKLVCPELEYDKFFGADVDCELPSGEDLRVYDGVVLGGSGLHAYDDDPAVTHQIEFFRTVFEYGIPVLGSCWGMQIAVIAAGGVVSKSPLGRELSIARKVLLNSAGQSHPMYAGKSTVFDTPCIHLDEVTTIPDGATVLASNNHSYVQAISFTSGKSDVWGVQYHPEFDLHHMGRLAVMYDEMMVEGGFNTDIADVHSHAKMMEDLGKDHSKFDLAWKLSIDNDVLDDEIRTLEIRNWVNTKILS